ncbi:restriction endonuclease subunit S [Spiroplasma endosymbiont of Amphibalanus improvisus]|uniref:restriction endonuclease subunit S n=1 Tax=Spiroplasma endosymbiont of Amphibalanus improvisus TaxID=3066327 RepID=UPI00313B2993
MAIIKFKDIWSSKPVYGSGLAAEDEGKYKYLTQSEINSFIITKYTNDNSKMLQKNDFLISRAGTIDVYYHNKDEEIAFAGYLVKYNINKNICLNKYFYLYCKSHMQELISLSSSGSTMPKLNPPDLMDWKIKIPDIETQKSIIDIIESNKELFLKYIKYIPLDNLENCKKKCQIIIDIIEPIENISFVLNSLKLKIINIISKYGDMILNYGKESFNLSKQKEEKFNNCYYSRTGEIGDFNNEISGYNYFKEPPSRAKILLTPNNLYISRLEGERKILFTKYKNLKNLIISSGMRGLYSDKYKYSQFSVLMSDSFFKFKEIYSTGTTMQGLNDKSLNIFFDKNKFNPNYEIIIKELFKLMSASTELLRKINLVQKKLISLLVN